MTRNRAKAIETRWYWTSWCMIVLVLQDVRGFFFLLFLNHIQSLWFKKPGITPTQQGVRVCISLMVVPPGNCSSDSSAAFCRWLSQLTRLRAYRESSWIRNVDLDYSYIIFKILNQGKSYDCLKLKKQRRIRGKRQRRADLPCRCNHLVDTRLVFLFIYSRKRKDFCDTTWDRRLRGSVS